MIETYVANQIQAFGHKNYSSQMCLYVFVKWCVLLISDMYCHLFPKRGVNLEVRVMRINTPVVDKIKIMSERICQLAYSRGANRGGLYVTGCM